jgi:hypothetical protein
MLLEVGFVAIDLGNSIHPDRTVFACVLHLNIYSYRQVKSGDVE